ncbi:hypothetical protein AXE85_06805 [Gemella sp. oral taxon 928]|uniref:hypothetical protein n=1 Tax=unclassified Gemella TaxID=2624949 RepID=UPI00076826B3|nr:MULTISPECIES: hypothetical protein [unclassified Gemella]AME09877.1 hypothetical protein AXE85_06805 [Gemella sp. oral taxon 928]AXI26015.1 amylase-binding protein [Gemella sp. ND 6198]
MKKLLTVLTAAGLVVTAVAPVALAQGENPKSSNQLTQKKYVSWRDAADEAEKQIAAHKAEINEEAEALAATLPAKKALDNANAELSKFINSGYSGHDFSDKKAKLKKAVSEKEAEFAKAKAEVLTNVTNKYRKQFEERFIAAAKAQGNYYDETGEEANRTNAQRIEADIVAQGGKVTKDKNGNKVVIDKNGNKIQLDKNSNVVVGKDGKPVLAKFLPKTSAAK